MNFRTEIELSEFPFKLEMESKILTIGSCFSDNLGLYFQNNKINCLHNPFGVVFNPISIFRLLTKSINQPSVNSNYFTERDGQWYHYDFHSKLTSTNKKMLENELNTRLQKVRDYLQKANYLIITVGTAFAYRLKENNYVVANCHKQTSNNFEKELLTNKEIEVRFTQMYEKIKQLNPKIKLIFTLSPVRHTKDTLQGNNLSKSILRLAIHQFTSSFKDVYYFPTYEILMDDLRDYRYYSEDMIHINSVGQTYVLEHFRKTAFSDKLNTFIDNWGPIQSQLNHKPFLPDSEAHQIFLKKLLQKLDKMSKTIDVSSEKEIVKAQII
jgi:lysophospholipase L1-like esterase